MRAITPYTHRADSAVGTQNFKYNWNAQYIKPTDEEEAQYLALFARLLQPELKSNRALSNSDLQSVLNARVELHISPKVHLNVLKTLGFVIFAL